MPGSFLLVLHENLSKRAQMLRETVTSIDDDGLSAEIDDPAGALRRDVRDVTRALDTQAADEQIFGAIAATLGTTQAEQLYDLSRIETSYEA